MATILVNGRVVADWYAFDVVTSDLNTKKVIYRCQHSAMIGKEWKFGERNLQHWDIDTANEGALLSEISKMPGVIVQMKHSGGFFTYFLYHVGDKDLALLS